MQASASRGSDSSVAEQGEKSAWMMVWSLGSETGSLWRDSVMMEVIERLARHCGRIFLTDEAAAGSEDDFSF